MLCWLLRSELAIAPLGVTVRFTTLMEAYCRGTVTVDLCKFMRVGCGPYLHSLITQTIATDALATISQQIKVREFGGEFA